jgi:hypothetical protein
MQITASDVGTRRHERCKYGAFSMTASVATEAGDIAMPLCTWKMVIGSPDRPPWAVQNYAGADEPVHYERDCAFCMAAKERR